MMRRLEDDDEVNHIKNYFSRSNNNNSENNGHHSNNKQHMRYWIMGIRAYTVVKHWIARCTVLQKLSKCEVKG